MFIKRSYILSALFFFISYIFDCWDGNYARKYDIVTKFGDAYDHITDWVIAGTLFVLLLIRFYKSHPLLVLIPLTFLPVLKTSLIHFGCQEKYYEEQNQAGGFIKFTKKVCPYSGNDKNVLDALMKNVKYMGFGTVILYFCLLIILAYTVDNNTQT